MVYASLLIKYTSLLDGFRSGYLGIHKAYSASERGSQALSVGHLSAVFGKVIRNQKPESVDLRPVAVLRLGLGRRFFLIKT